MKRIVAICRPFAGIVFLLLGATHTCCPAQTTVNNSSTISAVNQHIIRQASPKNQLTTRTTLPAVIRVATKKMVPFSFIDFDGKWNGFSIELWTELARRLDVETQFISVNTVDELLHTVTSASADLAIAGITITRQREEHLDFTLPFYDSGLKILVGSTGSSSGPFQIIKAAFSSRFIYVVIGLILVLLFCGHLVWLAERRRVDSDFSPKYWAGLWDGFWWSAVTVTTVGYGDKAPKGPVGKVVGILWMFVSLFLISYFTASVTTALTVNRLEGDINGPGDLLGKHVAVPRGTTAVIHARSLGAEIREVDNIDTAYALVIADEVDAVVFDAPVLDYYTKTSGQGRVKTVGNIFKNESFGIAVPEGSTELREILNRLLLDIREDGTYGKLQEKWF